MDLCLGKPRLQCTEREVSPGAVLVPSPSQMSHDERPLSQAFPGWPLLPLLSLTQGPCVEVSLYLLPTGKRAFTMFVEHWFMSLLTFTFVMALYGHRTGRGEAGAQGGRSVAHFTATPFTSLWAAGMSGT